jgi:hypothetical protein
VAVPARARLGASRRHYGRPGGRARGRVHVLVNNAGATWGRWRSTRGRLGRRTAADVTGAVLPAGGGITL